MTKMNKNILDSVHIVKMFARDHINILLQLCMRIKITKKIYRFWF